MDVKKVEIILRFFTAFLLVLTCCLIGLDSQTKPIIASVEKTATFKDVPSFLVLVYVESVAAAYNVFHIVVTYGFLSNSFKADPKGRYKNIAWMCFLLDQGMAYAVFGVNSAACEASVLAVTGSNIFEWMKLCNIFGRFCVQVGGALLSGYLATISMILLSSISAFNLFRLYSPKLFPLLKPNVGYIY